MIRYSFQFLSSFHPIKRDSSVSTPRIWYAGLLAEPRGRCQPLTPRLATRLVIGSRRCSWNFIPHSRDDFRLTWSLHWRYWLAYKMWIQICISFFVKMYPRVRYIFGEGRPTMEKTSDSRCYGTPCYFSFFQLPTPVINHSVLLHKIPYCLWGAAVKRY